MSHAILPLSSITSPVFFFFEQLFWKINLSFKNKHLKGLFAIIACGIN